MIQSNKSLFIIQEDLRTLIETIEEAGGEVTEEQTKLLAISRTELQTKSLNYVHYIKKLENDLQLAEVYEDQIEQFKKTKKKLIEKLKESLLVAVDQFGDIETEIFKVTTRKSESVEIVDIDKISSDYLNKKTTYTVNKDKIKSAVKAGLEVHGAIVKENKNLSIK
jgi:hypothetical protein